jgi:hypothetical protein
MLLVLSYGMARSITLVLSHGWARWRRRLARIDLAADVHGDRSPLMVRSVAVARSLFVVLSVRCGSLKEYGALAVVGSLDLLGTLQNYGSLMLIGALSHFGSLLDAGALAVRGSLPVNVAVRLCRLAPLPWYSRVE